MITKIDVIEDLKEAAEKYIEENKPKYTEKDVLDAILHYKHCELNNTLQDWFKQWKKTKN